MKISLILLFTFLYGFNTKAQDILWDEDIKELTKLTADTNKVYGIRGLLFSDLLDIEKEGFTKEYDSIIAVFYTGFEKYYREHYTKEEAKQLLDFYKMPVGTKLAADLAKLYQGNLPEAKPLQDRLQEMHDSLRNNYEDIPVRISQQSNPAESDIGKLLDAIGVDRYLQEVKANEIMNIEPKMESKLIDAFNKLAVQYTDDLKSYFIANYSREELKELLSFYKTSLGKKVKESSEGLIKTTFNANDVFVDNIQSIIHDTTFGKFQREYFKKNKQ